MQLQCYTSYTQSTMFSSAILCVLIALALENMQAALTGQEVAKSTQQSMASAFREEFYFEGYCHLVCSVNNYECGNCVIFVSFL